jgi:hypothetical protein
MSDRKSRQWDALGLVFQFAALFAGLAVVVLLWEIGVRVTGMGQPVPQFAGYTLVELGVAAAIQLVVAVVLWRSRRQMVSGGPRIMRLLGAVLFVLMLLGTVGLVLLPYLVAYLIVGRKPSKAVGPKPTDAVVSRFRPNAVAGTTDVTGYIGSGQAHPTRLRAGTPVQVLAVHGTFGDVLAADGWRAWVDLRMLRRAS